VRLGSEAQEPVTVRCSVGADLKNAHRTLLTSASKFESRSRVRQTKSMPSENKAPYRLDAVGCAPGFAGRMGAETGGRRLRLTDSGGTGAMSHIAFPQFRGHFDRS
jgi:hypothetical protein